MRSEDPIDGSRQGLFDPRCYVVVFTSLRTAEEDGYQLTSAAMSYWRDLEAIAAWRRAAEHLAAHRAGRSRW
jgi:heme-degrading monooxygenase HmoA